MKSCVVAALIGMLALVGCSSDEAPSAAAIKAGEVALEAARTEASKYVPNELAKLEATLKSAQDKFQAKDFAGALAAARDLGSKAQDMGKAALTRKEELTRAWEDINLALPGEMERLNNYLDNLPGKLPAGLDAAQLQRYKADFTGLGDKLQQARQLAQTGEIPQAVDVGSEVKAKVSEIAQAVGAIEAQ